MCGEQFVRADNHVIDAVTFRKLLIAWGQTNFRSFPWRLTRDPYNVLIAEIMLHRTQASQVVPVYKKFVEYYPDIPSLAEATIEELQGALYSLGLRWRIDLIHSMATELMIRFEGKVPQEKFELQSLPGISDYIACAVRCFVWNIAEPIIDTNVVRVISRLFGLEVRDSSRRNQRFKYLITSLVDPEEPRIYNYALLDLADQVCMKKRPPECIRCPVQKMCLYRIRTLTNLSMG